MTTGVIIEGGAGLGTSTDPLVVDIGGAGGSAQTAFGYERVAVPNIMLSGTFETGTRAQEFVTDTTGAGSSATHSTTTSVWTLTADSAADDNATLQSHRYIPYYAGQSQRIDITGRFGTAVAGVRKRMGYFDDDDGIFLEQNGTSGIRLVLRTSTSGSASDANAVDQADWDDPLDGTGASGATLTTELTGRIIFTADLQWLGVGDVRCYIKAQGGAPILVHTFENSGAAADVPYMKTARLPARWQVYNVSGAGGAMTAFCVNVAREGGAVTSTFGTGRPIATAYTATTTETAIMHIRLTSANNRQQVSNVRGWVLNTGSNDVIFRVYKDATLAVAATGWTSHNADSSVEYSTTQGGISAEGYIMDFGGAPGSSGNNPSNIGQSALREQATALHAELDGTSEIATLTAQTIASTSAILYGMYWQEEQ